MECEKKLLDRNLLLPIGSHCRWKWNNRHFVTGKIIDYEIYSKPVYNFDGEGNYRQEEYIGRYIVNTDGPPVPLEIKTRFCFLPSDFIEVLQKAVDIN
jgi:hypothetical protein